MSKRGLNAVPYYGGKFSHLRKLLPQLAVPHRVYVEPFCGSAAVALNKPPVHTNVCSDADGEVVNFFRVLRENPDELMRLLSLTPFNINELQDCNDPVPPDSSIERARRFCVRACQSRSGFRTHFSRATARGSRCSTWVRRWQYTLPKLVEVAQRFEWDNCDYESMFRRCDSTETLFYLDPPYLGETREYRAQYSVENMGADFHSKLLADAKALAGKVAISGYDSDLYNEALQGWHRVAWEVSSAAGTIKGNSPSKRTEVLWRNYELASDKQSALFSGG